MKPGWDLLQPDALLSRGYVIAQPAMGLIRRASAMMQWEGML